MGWGPGVGKGWGGAGFSGVGAIEVHGMLGVLVLENQGRVGEDGDVIGQ